MGMLFARRKRNKNEGITTTESLLPKEQKRAESVKPIAAKSVPVNVKTQVVQQPKFKV